MSEIRKLFSAALLGIAVSPSDVAAAEVELREVERGLIWDPKKLAMRAEADAELLKVFARYKRFPDTDTDAFAVCVAVERWIANGGGT
jgi:hypothetical protein